ncbi:MAG: Rieske 2Fe-2S domain-containing protein, partial [Rhodospirillaceae bacterium]|nr:Rieske 2Fe-2S domain-containing protein [Rhodospirillaceae bacterium]
MLRDLVRSDRVHGRLYTDPAIFDLEMERIFGRAWIFVAHESQIRAPGDWVTTRIGKLPVIVTRDKAGKIGVFENRCPHRGAMLCAGDKGHAQHGFFQCGYHDWTFHCDGRLRSVPAREGYSDYTAFQERLALRRVPHTASYRGFVFACVAEAPPDLDTFLGHMKSALDDIVDRAPDGEVEFAGGCYRVTTPTNWKLQVENLNDLLHAGATHRSAVDAGDAVTAPMPAPPIGQHRVLSMKANGAPISQMDTLGVHVYDRGHSYIGGLPRPPRTGPVMEAYRALLADRHGPQRADAILSVDRHINIIYPSLLTQGLFGQVKVLYPLAA